MGRKGTALHYAMYKDLRGIGDVQRIKQSDKHAGACALSLRSPKRWLVDADQLAPATSSRSGWFLSMLTVC
jgi:hypothetical protein